MFNQPSNKANENYKNRRKPVQQFNVPRATLQFRRSEKFRNKTSYGLNLFWQVLKRDYWTAGFYCLTKEDFHLGLKMYNHLWNIFWTQFPEKVPSRKELVCSIFKASSWHNLWNWYKKQLSDVSESPTQICNEDYNYFWLCPNNRSSERNKNVYEMKYHSKTNLTVMFTFQLDITIRYLKFGSWR